MSQPSLSRGINIVYPSITIPLKMGGDSSGARHHIQCGFLLFNPETAEYHAAESSNARRSSADIYEGELLILRQRCSEALLRGFDIDIHLSRSQVLNFRFVRGRGRISSTRFERCGVLLVLFSH